MTKHWEDRGASPEEDRRLGTYEIGTITEVRPGTDGWSISYGGTSGGGSWGCFCRKVEGHAEPKVGDIFTCFGRFGRPIHGQQINDDLLWYETPDEQEMCWTRELAESKAKRKREWEEKGRAEQDARLETLPVVFRERILRFRKSAGEEWRWEPMGESYEGFVYEQATILARWALDSQVPSLDQAARVQAACAKIDAWAAINSKEHDPPFDFQEQMRQAPPGFSDGHSGYTFSGAVAFAKAYLEGADL